MNISKEIIDFINKIIDKAENEEELIKNLNTYKDYLYLTEIYDNDTLDFISKVISNSNHIISMKNNFGVFDVKSIIVDNKDTKKSKTIKEELKEVLSAVDEEEKAEKEKVKVIEKHYHHYTNISNDSYSSGCGGGGGSASRSC